MMLGTRRAFYAPLAGFVLFIVALVLLAHFFDLLGLIISAQQAVLLWGDWSGVCYPFLFAACNLLLLPGGILCVGSGFFFGLWWGFFLVMVGNIISAALSFALSRWIFHRAFQRWLSSNHSLAALGPVVEREGWKIILLSQLHPLFPTSLITYFYGLTSVRFRTYMLWTTIGRAPGLFVYVYVGTLGQYGLNLLTGKSHPRVIEYWTWGGLFVVTCLILALISRVAFREFQRTRVDK